MVAQSDNLQESQCAAAPGVDPQQADSPGEGLQHEASRECDVRRSIMQADTVVVKVGSSSLASSTGHLDPKRLGAIVTALSHVVRSGAHLVLVSSGAVAAGFGPLGFETRPDDPVTRQAAAAVGQGLLMAQYEGAFSRYGVRVGQVLMTAFDTIRSSHYHNVQSTLKRMLELGVVPIVNENDTLVTSEVRFGDNDRLSALVANMVRADALVLLTDVDALYTAPPTEPGAQRIGFVPDVVAQLDGIKVGESTSGVGTGGMVTKLEAARIAAVSGIPTVLTTAAYAGPALMGDPVGTVFAPLKHRGTSRRLWIRFASNPKGTVVADAGAVAAVRGGRASLLAAGTVGVDGVFSAGDPIWIDSEQGVHVAKGLAGFDSDEIPQMLGRTSKQLSRFLGEEYARPVVHRDNLVLV
ncbi:glutamate 5-kinase [Pseudoscardovia suis]|uniref:Glutamate 5-kinase n=2 Tax=Pseudoscardovia suis TaxID=987063 RepID=A0A261F3W0_9BIFI|nr:glutamate 5-kinase [Pseudoscardovia suis]PJJ62662.1 glutamate 5-kinase [Pseudoscardovia suis]